MGGRGGTDSPYYQQVKQLLAGGGSVRAVGFQFHVISDWAIDGILDGTGYTPESLYNVYELFSGFRPSPGGHRSHVAHDRFERGGAGVSGRADAEFLSALV
jgi:hypothetical protein